MKNRTVPFFLSAKSPRLKAERLKLLLTGLTTSSKDDNVYITFQIGGI